MKKIMPWKGMGKLQTAGGIRRIAVSCKLQATRKKSSHLTACSLQLEAYSLTLQAYSPPTYYRRV